MTLGAFSSTFFLQLDKIVYSVNMSSVKYLYIFTLSGLSWNVPWQLNSCVLISQFVEGTAIFFCAFW